MSIKGTFSFITFRRMPLVAFSRVQLLQACLATFRKFCPSLVLHIENPSFISLLHFVPCDLQGIWVWDRVFMSMCTVLTAARFWAVPDTRNTIIITYHTCSTMNSVTKWLQVLTAFDILFFYHDKYGKTLVTW